MPNKNVLAFGCSHIPFEHRNFLDFILETKEKEKCGTVVCVGDLVDNHAFSAHFEQDPNGHSPRDEIAEARKRLLIWYKRIPSLFLSLGNHDERVNLKAKHVGLPDDVMVNFRNIWHLPKKWKDDYSHEIDGIRYFHGTGLSGDNAPEKASLMSRQSTVIAHIHHNLKCGYMASLRDKILYMGVGCGVDIKKYAFVYNRDFAKRPVLGCGVIYDGGKGVRVFPMEL